MRWPEGLMAPMQCQIWQKTVVHTAELRVSLCSRHTFAWATRLLPALLSSNIKVCSRSILSLFYEHCWMIFLTWELTFGLDSPSAYTVIHWLLQVMYVIQTAFTLSHLLVPKELLFPIHRFTTTQDNFFFLFYFPVANSSYSLPTYSPFHCLNPMNLSSCFYLLGDNYQDISSLIMNYYFLFLLNALPFLPNQYLIKIPHVYSCASLLSNKTVSTIVVCKQSLLLRSSFSLWAISCIFFLVVLGT